MAFLLDESISRSGKLFLGVLECVVCVLLQGALWFVLNSYNDKDA